QDINVLSSPQNQQCTENSTQTKGDEALSHLLSDIPILSGNGAGNN
ncbi:RdlA protein, partial [Streptomyces sp. KAI-26]